MESNILSFLRSACAYTIALITEISQKTTHSRSKRSILRVQAHTSLIIPTSSPKKISRVSRIAWLHSAKHDPFYTSRRNVKRRGESRARDGSLMCERRYPVCHLPEMASCIRSQCLEHTALAGAVSEEFNCLPVENEEFRRISEMRALEALKPRKETVFIDKIPGKIIQARHALPSEKGQFVVSLRIVCF